MALGPEDRMGVNLIFVAGDDDVIWSALESVSLLGDSTGADEISIGAGQLAVSVGEIKGESTLVNVKFSFTPLSC